MDHITTKSLTRLFDKMHPSDTGRRTHLDVVWEGASVCGADEEWAVGALLAWLADHHAQPCSSMEYGSGDSRSYTVFVQVQTGYASWERRSSTEATLLEALIGAVDLVLDAA